MKAGPESREYNRQRYAWYREHGICVECGQRPAFYNHVRCEYCLEKMAKYRESTEAIRAYRRERRKKLIERGICQNCGKPVYAGSKIFCEACHSRYKAKQRIKKREKYEREIKSEERDKHNREVWCKNLDIARKSPKWLAYIEERKAWINNLMCSLHKARLERNRKL